MTSNSINKLPLELLPQIFQHISSRSTLLQCALVSRNWSYYALQLLWHKPIIHKPKSWLKFSKTLALENTFISYPPLVRCINLSSIPEFVGNDTFKALSLFKQLDRLTLAGCNHITNDALVQFLNQNIGRFLLSLDLSEMCNLSDETIMTIADTCKHLQGLNLNVSNDRECYGITDKSILHLVKNCKDLLKIRLSGWKQLTDESIIALATSCPDLLEIDISCSITNTSLYSIFKHCRKLRELKLNQCQNLNDLGFFNSPLGQYHQLRTLELTNIMGITDVSIDCITRAAPKLRTLVLNKCFNITDKSLEYITRLGSCINHLHLGNCRNITDIGMIKLASKCTRLRYIDVSNCHLLSDESVIALAFLPKLKRIGLVKCQRITDRAILAITRHPRTSVSLERIHLSYCDQLTAQAICVLLIHCRRLTHLSLSFIPAFQQEEFKKFCMPLPKDYTAEVSSFCVFSGKSLQGLRKYILTKK